MNFSFQGNYHAAEDSHATFQTKALRLGRCPKHPDIRIVIKQGWFDKTYVACRRCEEIHARRLGPATGTNNNDLARPAPSATDVVPMTTEVLPTAKATSVPQEEIRSELRSLADHFPCLRVLTTSGSEYTVIEKLEVSTGVVGLYYLLPHNGKYQVEMTNPFLCKCTATLNIDGYVMGTWILQPGQISAVNRPATEAKLFTFIRTSYAALADEAARKLSLNKNAVLTPEERQALGMTPTQSGVQKGREKNGLITMSYQPQKENSFVYVNEHRLFVDVFTSVPDILEKLNVPVDLAAYLRLQISDQPEFTVGGDDARGIMQVFGDRLKDHSSLCFVGSEHFSVAVVLNIVHNGGWRRSRHTVHVQDNDSVDKLRILALVIVGGSLQEPVAVKVNGTTVAGNSRISSLRTREVDVVFTSPCLEVNINNLITRSLFALEASESMTVEELLTKLARLYLSGNNGTYSVNFAGTNLICFYDQRKTLREVGITNGSTLDVLSDCGLVGGGEVNMAAGATTLQGESSQRFRTGQAFDVDEERAVNLQIRLVCDRDEDVETCRRNFDSRPAMALKFAAGSAVDD